MAAINASPESSVQVAFSVNTDDKTVALVTEKTPSATLSSITFSVNAANKVASLIAEEEDPALNLRVYITGGGCSGFQYGFTFDKVIQEDDTVIEQRCSDGKSTVKLLVDSMSYQYLQGAEIDFTSRLEEQFKIYNPNAKTTCGCGSSFSIDDDE